MMNEELQLTNAEMHSVNDELRDWSIELNEVNAYLASILGSLRAGVIVVYKDLLVRVWNSWSEEEWGLRTDEVLGKNVFNLDIGLPVDELREPLRRLVAAEGYETRALEALNRRGRRVRLRVELTSLLFSGGRPGVMLLSHKLVASEDGEEPADAAA